MPIAGGEVAAIQWIDIAMLSTALILGLRQRTDWNHIAAITDITAAEPTARRSFTRATIYAAGAGCRDAAEAWLCFARWNPSHSDIV